MRVARRVSASHTAAVASATIDLLAASSPDEILGRAADVLKSGGIIVLPTETVYGAAASAAVPGALDLLWRIKGPERRAPLAWHLHSTQAALDALRQVSPDPPSAHRRMIRTLTPGPVTFAVPASPERLASLRSRLGVGEGVLDDGAELFLRVPDRGATRRVIERAGIPVVIGSLGGSALARTAAEAEAALRSADAESIVPMILDSGPVDYSRQSTLIRLLPTGEHQVVRAGALDERTIRRSLIRTILFVCTGNTCRSPMAAAIARHLVEQLPPSGIETRIRSAGVSAGFGMAPTPEGVEALRDRGIEMGRHASTPLTREMINEAELIFAMTRSHAEAVVRMEPSAASRVLLLDPEGRDIPDPIGSPREAYDRTADRLLDAIRRRLGELTD